jgi:carbonic anhydrase
MKTDGIMVDVFRALGLTEGDAHVIRNAGGRASDALRSIIISQQLLGTREIVVVHHVPPPIPNQRDEMR